MQHLLFFCCSAVATAPMMLSEAGTEEAPAKEVGEEAELRREL